MKVSTQNVLNHWGFASQVTRKYFRDCHNMIFEKFIYMETANIVIELSPIETERFKKI